MVHVILAPYLQVGREPLRVGPWEAVPAGQLERRHSSSDLALEQARGLLELYQRSHRVRGGFGVFLRRGRGLVGEDFRVKDLSTLRRALLVAVLDRNPSQIGAGEEDPNAGHRVWTSDNLDIFGHRIQPNGYVSARYGAMTQQLIGGLRIGNMQSEIAPPIEVPFPPMGTPLDSFYSNALWDVLSRDTPDVRRLASAIDWLDVAWRNTPSTTHNVRILMLKSAFEVLLGRGDRVERQRPALSALLDPRRPRRRIRHFTDRWGNPLQEAMTDLEWWFTRFTFLRNAIIHGRDPTPRDMRHGRAWHLWIAEYRLRQAIKHVVAQHGDPLVLLDEADRAFMLAAQRLGVEL